MAITSINLSSLDGANGFRLEGVAESDGSGSSVSNAGDINGDGFDDVIVGVSRADPNGENSGSSYLVFGKASGFDAAINLSALNGDNGFRMDGVTPNDLLGRQVSGAGDVNGDGFDDLIIGVNSADPNSNDPGSSYVVFGKAAGFAATLDLTGLDGSNGFRLDGVTPDNFLNSAVSSAGDVNGDGFDDVIIGGTRYDSIYSSPATVGYLVFGAASGFNPTLNLSSLDGSNGFQLRAEAYGAIAQSVSSAGDINGDGFEDLVIGIDRTIISGYRSESVSYVVFGKASGFDAALDLTSLDGSNGFRLTGVQFGPYSYGVGQLAVSNAGDINGDGFDDLIVGSPSGGNYYAGVSYVVFGKADNFGAVLSLSSLDGTNGFRLEGVTAFDRLGDSVSGAGDVNGDGFDDLIIGAVGVDPYGTSTGASYVIFGKASGFAAALDLSNLDVNDGIRLDGVAVGDGLGASVSSAGDINNDGFDDLIVGAPRADPHGRDSGASYVLFGSSSFTGTRTLLGTVGDDTLTGTAAIERFSAGDGNDILIGGGGADVINGDAGDDSIRVPDLDFQIVNGGTGNDTLELTGSGISLTLADFRDDDRISDIETIDLTGSGDNTLTITEHDVLNLSDSSNTLVVKGNAGDHVAGLSQGWSDGGIQGNFHAYIRHGATLLIDSAVSTDPLTPSVINLSNLNGSNGFRLDGIAEYSRISVSSAGDVNGDGFGDLIIGNYGTDPNGARSGSSYVVFGKAAGFDATMALSSLDGSNGFRLDGAAALDDVGRSVSNAGDVNGDGFDDVIIGASEADPNGDSSGSSYVVFGKASGFDAAMSLSSLDGRNGFRLDGVAEDDFSGGSVSSAGDVNDDRFDDLIIGASGADPNGSYSGSSYVVFGKASGFDAAMSLSSLDGSNGFRLDGLTENDRAGASVSSAGDVNGDGFDDLIIGAVYANPNGNYSGSSYVVFGRASGFTATTDLSNLDGSNGFRLVGGAAGAYSNFTVSNAGDVNGDDFADVIVGARGENSSGDYSGFNCVVFGKAAGFAATMDLSDVDGSNGFRLVGNAGKNYSYYAVSNAGDVNGDGFDDVIVGSKSYSDNSSSSHVVFGRASGFDATLDLSSLDGSNGVRLDVQASINSVSGAGDVNGDGFADLVVGGSVADANGSIRANASYVIFGSANFRDIVTFVGTSGDDTLTGTTAAERFEAGDGNDIMVGGGGADVFQGGAGDDVIRVADADFLSVDGAAGNDALELTGSVINLNLASFSETMRGIEAIDLTGSGDNTLTLTAQDVLNLSDTSNTLIVNGNVGDRMAGLSQGWADGGKQGNFNVFTQRGAVLLIDAAVRTDPLDPGVISLSNLDGSNGFRVDGVATYDLSGGAVSSAGDVNGDGFGDVIIGAGGADPNGSQSGSSYVVFGRASGFDAEMDLSSLDGNNGFRLGGVAAFDSSGTSVSSVEDINGDGFDDVIIGAAVNDPNDDYSSYSGSSYVVFGKASGFSATVNLSSLDGNTGFRLDGVSDERSSFEVSNAGDINGDGFDDVIVGLPYAGPYGSQSGYSYVVFGKAGGFDAAINLSSLNGSNGFRLDGADDGDRSGWSVSGAGDVNGDGFDDAIVGAFDAEPNGARSGSSYVLFGRASGFDAALQLSSIDGSNGFRLDGVARYDFSGYSVSSAGDVNGDGFDDVIIGAPGAEPNGARSGSSYVVFGRALGFDAAMSLSSLDGNNGFRVDGEMADDQLGRSVSSAGDVNGDGFDDVIIGSYGYTGSAYVVFGRASGFDATLDLASLNGSNGIRLDGVDSVNSVSGAGDMNGDGFDDLLVGTSLADQNGEESGASFVIFGRSDFGGGQLTTIPGTPDDDVLRGTSAAEIFDAGDGNDILIGRGGADVFHGGAGVDQIKVPDLSFQSIDGGTGNDILHLDGKGLNLDLTSVGGNIQNIETICIYGRGDNTLTLTADSVLDLSDTANTLKVNGNAGDRITVLDNGWVDQGPRGLGYYHVYTHDDAVLLIGTNVTIDFA